MRFIPFILSLAACSEYGIVPELDGSTAPPDFVPTEELVTDTVDTTTGVTEETAPDSNCWFGTHTWPLVDTDNDGEGDHLGEVGVKTLPVYSLVGPSDLTVSPGEDVTIQVAVTSYNECGDIDFNSLLYGVFDRAENSHEWLKTVNDDVVESELGETVESVEFAPYAADNMNVTPTGDQLHYIWQDGSVYFGSPANIAAQRVGASEERVFQFNWTASEYAPLGSTITIMLVEATWTDVTSGQRVLVDTEPMNSTEVTIHIE